MAIFHSYVCLPEGKIHQNDETKTYTNTRANGLQINHPCDQGTGAVIAFLQITPL